MQISYTRYAVAGLCAAAAINAGAASAQGYPNKPLRIIVPGSGSSLWLGPYLHKNLPYDPVKDFLPLTMTMSSPTILKMGKLIKDLGIREE